MAIIFDERGIPITGGNPFPVKEAGSTLVEQLTDADEVAGDLTFSAPIEYVEIFNTDSSNAGVFTVNTVNIAVPANAVFGPTKVGSVPSATVSVSGATTSYIVSRYV
jgi:hypothetical protein